MTDLVGEQLINAREQKRLTIEQAAFATKINPEYLKALESGERELLPSAVQGKGFLRLYAGFLGLDIQPLLNLWEGNPNIESPQEQEQKTVLVAEDFTADEENQQKQNIDDITGESDSASDRLLDDFEIKKITAKDSEELSLDSASQYFQNVGKELRHQREILGLEHKDIEKFTHVRAHYLKALEEGRIDDLPSYVQAQGMLTNYATFLEVDVENILLQYANGLQARREALATPMVKQTTSRLKTVKNPQRRLARFLSGDLLISGSVILILLGFAIWAAISISAMRNTNKDSTPISISELLLSTLQQTPLEGNSETAPTGIPTSLLANENGGAPVATLAPNITLAPENNSPIQVTVIGRDRTWLKITIDGTVTFNDRIVTGNAYPFSATESLELVTGDASSIQIYYKKQDIGTLGLKGQVLKLTFDLSGVITPTSVPLPTDTPTIQVTSTPTASATPDFTPTVTPYVP